MGLDMFAYKRKNTDLMESVDFVVDDESAAELHYWRKHPNLHGWMENLYRKKGGKSEDFNCANLMLNKEDLIRLEIAIKTGRLPFTQGFFFGESKDDDDQRKEDLEFVRKANEALDEGYEVYYTSWW